PDARPKLGVAVVAGKQPAAAVGAGMPDNTKGDYSETIGNPDLKTLDIRAVADVAHAAGVPLILDNTLPAPYLVRPIEHGADIVVHSATKFIGGHSTPLREVLLHPPAPSRDHAAATSRI